MRPLQRHWVCWMMVAVWFGLAAWALGQDADADQAKALLARGLKQYKALDFVQAKATLLKVKRDKLTDADRKVLDSYLKRVDEAIKKQAAAQEAYDAAVKALEANKLQEAARLFEQAAASEFLKDAVRAEARKQAALARKRIEVARVAAAARKPKPAAGSAKPQVSEVPAGGAAKGAAAASAGAAASKADDEKLKALQQRFETAKAETAKGDAAMGRGELNKAIEHFNKALQAFPGYRPAREKLLQAQGLLARQGPGLRAISRLEKQRRIRKTETEVRFNQAIKRAREVLHVAKSLGDFTRAAEEVKYAQTLLVTNKGLFTDAEYRARKIETDQLLEFISSERDKWQLKRVREQEAEIQRAMVRRQWEMERRRREKIATLKKRAIALRSEQKYAEAVEVLDRIRRLDPKDSWAQEQYDILSRFVLLLEDREAHRTSLLEEQKNLVDIRRTAIPWYELLRYPRDWPEITLKRRPFGAGEMAESEANRGVRKALRQVLPKLDFTGIAFGDVIQFLRDISNLNIHVKWEALRQANIDQKTPVNVKLTRVTVEKALKTILDDVGGVNPLGFVIDEGVITISTKDDLSRQTITRVYDIRDLIVRVPIFKGPRINLAETGGNDTTSSNVSDGGLFGDDDDDDDDDDTEEGTVSRSELVNNILDLIRSTIAPDTWRGGEASGTIGSVRELNGQLIVTQTPENHRALQDLLAQLREARALQINIEARFITVNSGFLNRIGVDLDFYFNLGSRLGGGTAATYTDPVTGATVSVPAKGSSVWTSQGFRPKGWNYLTPMGAVQDSYTWVTPVATSVTGSIGSVTNSALTFAGTFLDDVQVNFLINATQAHQSTRTLTAPHITIFNGQRAYVAIGTQRAYVSDLEPVVAENAIAFNPSVDVINLGTMLDVEGTVSADRRYVNITARPQVTQNVQFFQYAVTVSDTQDVDGETVPVTGSGFIQLPQVESQQVECSVSVPDGGTLLLGGQKLAGEVEREMGVPLLSKVPILNRIFSNRVLVRDEQTLLILIKPKIIIQREYEEAAFPPQ